MRKQNHLLIIAALVLILSACGVRAVMPERGEFAFALPKGYSFWNMQDLSCSILRQEDKTVVGGFEVTGLTQKALLDRNTKDILVYLQNDFHRTNDVEFFALEDSKNNPVVSIMMTRHNVDGEESREFYHRFFEKDGAVYHMWLDGGVMELCDYQDFTNLLPHWEETK